MIRITEATSPEQMKKFVKFPFSLYKDTPQWVPPLIRDEIALFDRQKNPVFKDAEAWFYLAYRNNELAGRIAVIVNWAEIKAQGTRKIRFGWFDFVDDLEVSSALLEKAVEKGKELELDYVEGPMGFSNLDKVGMITKGFDTEGSMITWYNHAYYPKHMESLGYEKEMEFMESIFPAANADPELFTKPSMLIRKRYGLRSMSFTSSDEIMPYVDEMFDLFNATYSRLSSFVAISDQQKEYMKKKYINFINPEFIKFIFNEQDQMVAFAIVMPSFTEALKKSRGRLFPFGWYYLLQARKKVRDVIFYLIGIREDYQNKGLTAIIFEEYHKTFSEMRIRNCYRTPELVTNTAIHQMWKHFDPKETKRRCTFKKGL